MTSALGYTPAVLFYLSANPNYQNAKLSNGTDQQFYRYISDTGHGAGPSGYYVVMGVYCHYANQQPADSPVGGIFTGAGGTGSAIVTGFTFPNIAASTSMIALPLNTSICANPVAGGNGVVLTGTPYLYLSSPSANTNTTVDMWIVGYELWATY